MTTISHKRRRKNSPLIPVAIILGLVVLVGGVILLRNPLASTVWVALEQGLFLGGRAGGSMSDFFAGFISKAVLEAENKRLRDTLATTSAMLLDRDLLYEENKELRARLRGTPVERDAFFAQVILHPPGTPYDTLILDVGKQDGVVQGNLVSPGGSVVIGTVDQVYHSTSRVLLFSAPGTTHNALLNNTTPLVVVGQGGGSMTAEVPAGVSVVAGDTVAFVGDSLHFSAAVVATEIKAGASFTTLYLSLPVNIFSLRFVEVLHNTALYEEE